MGVKLLVSRLALVEGEELKAELAALGNSGGSKERAARVKALLAPAVAAKRAADIDAAIVSGVVARAFARVLAPPAPAAPVEAPVGAVQSVVESISTSVKEEAISVEGEGKSVCEIQVCFI